MKNNINRKRYARGQVAMTLSLEPIVAVRVQKISAHTGQSKSVIVNNFLRRLILSDTEVWRELKRQAMMDFRKYEYLEKEAENVAICIADE